MTTFLNNIWAILTMAVFLAASGTFSGAETAFFNISARKKRLFLHSKHRLERLAGNILLEPKKLLTSLLLANMMVNVFYFAFSTVLLIDIGKKQGGYWTAAGAVVFFFILLLFGEMLPKSLAFKNSDRICVILALPCYFCVKILHPIQHFFNFLIAEPLIKLFGGGVQSYEAVSVNQLKYLIDSTRSGEKVSNIENQIMTRILELNFIKVRQILQPRVDMVMCSINSSTEQARKILQKAQLRFLPVYGDNIDDIKGIVDLRDVLLSPNKSLKQLVQKVCFVPEQKSVDALLEHFYKTGQSTAIVVDEYGGITGKVDTHQIAERIFSHWQDQQQAVEKIGPMRYRLSGNLPLLEWVQAFGVQSEQTNVSTIAGLVMTSLDKKPAEGDVVKIKNFKLEVEKVENNRIKTVILSLTAGEQDNDNSN